MASQRENLEGIRRYRRAVLTDPAVLAVPGLAQWMRRTCREIERDVRANTVTACTQATIDTMKRYRRDAIAGRLARVESWPDGRARFSFTGEGGTWTAGVTGG